MPTTADLIGELVDPIRHVETWHEWQGKVKTYRHHVAHLPCLIDQLAETVDPANNARGGGRGAARPKPASRPPINIDASDRLFAIVLGVRTWASGTHPGNLKARLRSLAAFVPMENDEYSTALTRDVKRWYGWCRTVAGWRNQAFRPDLKCPECDAEAEDRNGLRVRTLDGASKVISVTDSTVAGVASCLTCGAIWAGEQFQDLVEYMNISKGEVAA